MSSIAAGANPERTNRWLLIGAAALALLAGVLIFVGLQNASGSDGGSDATSASAGSVPVLVAKDTIPANTAITADMFETRSVPQSIEVVNPVTDSTAIVGKVTRSEILKGQQLSFDSLGISRGKVESQLAWSVTQGQRGYSVPVSAAQIVSGLVVPDDRVDVVITYTEKRDGQSDVTRVETLLQNIRVLAVAQTTVETQPSLDAQGTPIAQDPTQQLGARPTDVEPNPSAGTATLELSPDQVQTVTAALAKGTLSLALRGVGDDKPVDTAPLYQDEFGRLPRPATPTP